MPDAPVPDARLARDIDRCQAALLAQAAGDALGALCEFPSRSVRPGTDAWERLRERTETYREGGEVRSFHPWTRRFVRGMFAEEVPAGGVTDDTQLALCVARSIGNDGALDPVRLASVELPEFLAYERGCGVTTRAGIESMTKVSTSWNDNFFRVKKWSTDVRGADGNGAAMRVAPVGLARRRDPGLLCRDAIRQAIPTHGHPRALVGSVALALGVALLVEGAATAAELPRALGEALGADAVRPLREDPALIAWSETWGSGFASSYRSALGTFRDRLDGLPRMASDGPRSLLEDLGCHGEMKAETARTVLAAVGLAATLDLEEAVVSAAGLVGTDTDTIAGMAGALAGAAAGRPAIPERWSGVEDAPYLENVGRRLAEVGLGRSPTFDPDLPDPSDDPPVDGPPVDPETIQAGWRVWHRAFGPGTVTDTVGPDTKGNITCLQIRTRFAFGQTLNIRSYRARERFWRLPDGAD